jgi:hypothetical protein
MQTFLPYRSFVASAQVLDNRRLGKQRVECKQILLAIERGKGAAWYNHPCTQMWLPHRRLLCAYACVICLEWRKRGYRDSLYAYFVDYLDRLCQEDVIEGQPWWLGDKRFHDAYKALLLFKDPAYYRKFSWNVSPREKTLWPKDIQRMSTNDKEKERIETC